MSQINFTLFDSGQLNSAGVSSFNTNSKTWASGHVYFMAIGQYEEADTVPTPTPTASGWTLVGTISAASYKAITILYKVGDGSTSAASVSFGSELQSDIFWAIADGGANTVNTTTTYISSNVKTATGGDITPTVTMDSLADATNNAILFAFEGNYSATATPESGWTNLYSTENQQPSSFGGLGWRLGGSDLTPGYTTATNGWRAIGVEVAAAPMAILTSVKLGPGVLMNWGTIQ